MSETNGILLRRHLRFGWWSLAFFLLIGTTLEAMHGLKVGYYLDASNSTRRLLWTLAHAHGALLGLVHLGFAATLGLGVVLSERSSRWASGCLAGASFLLPGGFAIGGWFAEAGARRVAGSSGRGCAAGVGRADGAGGSRVIIEIDDPSPELVTTIEIESRGEQINGSTR